MKIGLFADTHYCSKQSLCQGARIPQLALARLEEACGFFKSSGADLIVCLGDLINADDSEQLNRLNLEHISNVIRNTGIKCICIMGNHDREAFSPDGFASISGFTIASVDFAFDDCALHFLDANNTAEGKPYTKDDIDWTKCHVSDNDIRTLQETALDASKKHFFFFHQCVDPDVDSMHIIENAPALRKLIRMCNAKAVFQGHFHKGFSNIVDGIPYETLAALCSPDKNDYRLIETDLY